MEGYGSQKKIRTSKILDLSVDLPLILEIVDKEEKIDSILPAVKEMLKKVLITTQNVEAGINK